MKKLQISGVRGLPLDLFMSYLNDRKQTVFIDGHYSRMKEICCGVPQGSVLGPLFFLIYINDIGELNLKCFPNLFADDTAMFYYNSDISINIQLTILNFTPKCFSCFSAGSLLHTNVNLINLATIIFNPRKCWLSLVISLVVRIFCMAVKLKSAIFRLIN